MLLTSRILLLRQGIKTSQPLLPLNLAALPGSGEPRAVPHTTHRGGPGYSPFTSMASNRGTTSALLPISSRVITGFNERKHPTRTIAIAVDISEAFDTVSHSLLIEMINRSRLWRNLVRWLVAYLPQPSSTTLCLIASSPTKTQSPMQKTSRCYALHPA